jgi:hypothetical protein
MNYGRFIGGNHFKKYQEDCKKGTTLAQCKELDRLGIDYETYNLTWMQASVLIQKMKKKLLQRQSRQYLSKVNRNHQSKGEDRYSPKLTGKQLGELERVNISVKLPVTKKEAGKSINKGRDAKEMDMKSYNAFADLRRDLPINQLDSLKVSQPGHDVQTILTVYESTDYDKFKIAANRDVKESGVRQVMKTLQKDNMLKYNPIQISSDWYVVDGQHRLEATRRLGIPYSYIVLDYAYDVDKVMNLNGIRNTHTVKDKIQIIVKSGGCSSDLKEVERVYSKFDGFFKLENITSLFHGSDGGHFMAKIQEDRSKYKFKNVEKGLKVLDAIFNSAYRDRLKDTTGKCSNHVIKGLSQLSNHNETFPFEIMQRVDLNFINWITPRTDRDARKMILECYNYKLGARRRLVDLGHSKIADRL